MRIQVLAEEIGPAAVNQLETHICQSNGLAIPGDVHHSWVSLLLLPLLS